MKRWLRRHRTLARILGFALLVALTVSAGSKDPAASFAGLVLLIVLAWLGWQAVRRGIGRARGRNRSSGRSERPLPVPAAPIQPAAPPPTPAAFAAPSPVVRVVPGAPTIGDVLALTPAQFEQLTVRLLAALGYTQLRRTGGSGDLGADIVCRDPRGRSAVVQCKRYAPGSTIGTPVIQTFIGMVSVHHRADRGLFVATVGFSQPAIDLARQHGVVLVGGDALLLLLDLTGTEVNMGTMIA